MILNALDIAHEQIGEAPVLKDSATMLTYSALAKEVNSLAAVLDSIGAGPDRKSVV